VAGKALLAALAVALTLLAFVPYIRSILKRELKPHVFSWVIWGTTTCIVFLAQLADNGGAGAWPIGMSGAITLYIAMLAYRRRADTSASVVDWLFFIAAMTALPLWFVASDPLWAVVIVTAVDLLGFGPTLRKALHFPHEESLTFFALFTARNIIVVMALEHYSVTTVLFPAAIALACLLLITLVAYRRRVGPV